MSLKGKLAKMGIIARPGASAQLTDLSVADDLTIADTLTVTGLTTLEDGVVGITNPALAASAVMAATLDTYIAEAFRQGRVIKTTIYIDLTGAKSVAADKDIIGDTGACHIGQITTAINGVIFAGQVRCIEVPTTGADDIDLYASSVGTGAYDADVTGLANAQALMVAGGAHAIGTVKPFTVLPTADYYLYLASGEAVAGTYDAGILVIEMWGLVPAA